MSLYNLRNSKGITLVEVLGSIVLLTLIIVSFMNVLPQMTSFNTKTESKLISINLAKEEIAEIQSLIYKGNLTKDSIKKTDNRFMESPSPPQGTIGFQYQKKDHTYNVYFYTKPDLENPGHLKNVRLHKVHLKVKSKENIVSETYGYIEVISE